MDEVEDVSAENETTEFNQKKVLKQWYFKFLADFRDHLAEYIKESAIDLAISSVEVTTIPQKLAYGQVGGINLILKNQGQVECYLSTDRVGGYRLDPQEKIQFWLNQETIIMTLSGQTTLGFIRN